jgi:hypothetical protein
MPSTVIADFSYREREAELVVKFRSGRRYAYARVPKSEYDAMRAAPSKGSFFNTRIRDRYPTRRLDGP